MMMNEQELAALTQQQQLQFQQQSISMQFGEDGVGYGGVQGANPFELADVMLGCDDYDDSNVN